jgi:hypothetical protein
MWIRVGSKFKVKALHECFSAFMLHEECGLIKDPHRSWREVRRIRREYGGTTALVDRLFWIPYIEARIKLYRWTKWKLMAQRSLAEP